MVSLGISLTDSNPIDVNTLVLRLNKYIGHGQLLLARHSNQLCQLKKSVEFNFRKVKKFLSHSGNLKLDLRCVAHNRRALHTPYFGLPPSTIRSWSEPEPVQCDLQRLGDKEIAILHFLSEE